MKMFRHILFGGPVLEVGGGHHPYPQSHVLVDKMPDDDSQRGGTIRTGGRPLIVADIENLPFKDGAFEYSIASHVVEHAEGIAGAFSELERTSKAGYIETPSALFEIADPHSYHQWMLMEKSGSLMVYRKSGGSEHGLLAAMAESNFGYKIWIAANQELTKTALEWEGCIPFEMNEGEPSPDDYVDSVRQSAATFVGLLLRRIIERACRKLACCLTLLRKKYAVESFIRCPRCKGDVTLQADRIICEKCAGHYPRKGNVYYLSPEYFTPSR